MDKLNQYREIVQTVLKEYHELQLASADLQLESALLLDPSRDQYLLIRMGWDGNERLKRNTIHIRIKNQKIWIEEDETEDGVATELLQLGVPHQDIVLAFHPPQLRQHTEFAIA
jgi:XisI protein